MRNPLRALILAVLLAVPAGPAHAQVFVDPYECQSRPVCYDIGPTFAAMPTIIAPASADEVVVGLLQRGRPIGGWLIFDAASDPNSLLGRPNGYTAKATFVDERVPPPTTERWGVEHGGSVEMYPTAAGAHARRDYIQALGARASFLAEYTYTHGRIVLRLSRHLLPEHAAEYETALRQMQG